jgi:hypothetical protein
MKNASRFVAVWYLSQLVAVNATVIVLFQSAHGIAARAASNPADVRAIPAAGFECTDALAFTFAPPVVRSSRQRSPEVCVSNAPLASIVPAGWSIDALTAADVFAAVDPRVKRAVAILYGGQRPQVARGWIARSDDELESVTLVSPRPDPSLTRLMPGTLLIRVVTGR